MPSAVARLWITSRMSARSKLSTIASSSPSGWSPAAAGGGGAASCSCARAGPTKAATPIATATPIAPELLRPDPGGWRHRLDARGRRADGLGRLRYSRPYGNRGPRWSRPLGVDDERHGHGVARGRGERHAAGVDRLDRVPGHLIPGAQPLL